MKKISEIDIGNLKEEDTSRKKQIEEELHKMYDYFADGAILRSKCTWYEKGEKSNKYFLSLEKSQAESTSIDVLNTNDGLIREQANIQKFIKDSFQEFFKNKDQIAREACMDYINQSKLEQLTDSEKASCEGYIM